jgi:hypothetical protein
MADLILRGRYGKEAGMPRKPPVAPTCFVPSCPADFVGQAGRVAEVLLRKAEGCANPDRRSSCW